MKTVKTYRVTLREYYTKDDLDGTLIDMGRPGLTFDQATKTKRSFESKAVKQDGFKLRDGYLVDEEGLFRYRLFILED